MTEIFQTMVNFMNKGGPFMWPLLLCSIVTVATIVLAALTLRERKVLPLVIESEIERLMPGGSAERLMRIVNDDGSSLAARGSDGVAASALAAFGKYRSRSKRGPAANWCGWSAA